METLKVSTRSNPNSVAGAMAGVVRTAGIVEVQVVGAGALNQAIKALAIARSYVAGSGIDLVCVPSFADIDIDGERRTAIRLTIEHRDGPAAFAAVITQVDAGDEAVVDLTVPPHDLAAGPTAGHRTEAHERN
ncbi:hypothetical protein BH20ACT2_BH20ACT2_05030 [soil metagenome]